MLVCMDAILVSIQRPCLDSESVLEIEMHDKESGFKYIIFVSLALSDERCNMKSNKLKQHHMSITSAIRVATKYHLGTYERLQ